MTKYIVIHEYYDNDTKVSDFVQAIGTYDDMRTAYGAAYLTLCEFARENGEAEKISIPYQLEGDTGFGISLKHEKYTDVCFVLFDKGDGFDETNKE